MKEKNDFTSDRLKRTSRTSVDPLTRPPLHSQRWSSEEFGDNNERVKSFVNSKRNKTLVVFTLVIIAVGVFLELLIPPPAPEERSYVQLNASLEDLRKLFSSQSDQIWRVAKATMKPVLIQKEPKHPAIVLLGSSKKAASEADCLALTMSRCFNGAVEARASVVVVDCHEFKDVSPDKARRTIDEKLEHSFRRGSRVVAILAAESLPGEFPTFLHRFVNRTNAFSRKNVIVITFRVKSAAVPENEERAFEEVMRLWGPVSEEKEQLEALLGRIRNSVAYVQQEPDDWRCPTTE